MLFFLCLGFNLKECYVSHHMCKLKLSFQVCWVLVWWAGEQRAKICTILNQSETSRLCVLLGRWGRPFSLSFFFPGGSALSVYIARLSRILHLLPFKCFRLSFWVQSWIFSNCAIFGIWFQVPTLAAAAYLRMAGRQPVLGSNQLSYSENFLYMLDSL
jgi:hypothetical protein